MAVQISTFGFFAAVIGCAASTRGSWFQQHAQEIAMPSHIWNVRMQSWLRKTRTHQGSKECTSAVGPRCYHHCRQCGCTASRKGIRSPDNTSCTFCRSKKRNRQTWKRKGLFWNFFQCPSRFIRSFSKRGSWWTSWQSCPEILMLQTKIRWFTALLRCALGSTVMIPCFQLPPNQWSVYWCDSDWFRLFSHQKVLFGIQDATKHACSILHLQSPNVTMTCRVPCLQS